MTTQGSVAVGKVIPATRPKQDEEKTRAIIAKHGIPRTVDVVLVGIRGYYRDTMGKPGVNDRNLYDDAIFVVSPTAYTSYNANVDPSAYRAGIASLVVGVHWYKKGKHGISRKPPYVPYAALRPASPDESVMVVRDGKTGLHKGIAINIHKGGVNGTSSLGCQTIPPDQWKSFISLVYSEMDRYKQSRIPYVLVASE